MMLISLDKAFILELQACGYDIDYKSMVEIYRHSRESMAYKMQKRKFESELQHDHLFLKELDIPDSTK